VLLLSRTEKNERFFQQSLYFLNTLAPQFAVSIENVKLVQKRQLINLALDEKVLQRTEELHAANKELIAFIAAVSHDLKAPLRAISGFTGVLLEDYSPNLDDSSRRNAELLLEQSRNMGTIIDGLIAFSRSTQGALIREEVNLSTLVDDKLRWLRTMDPAHKVTTYVQQGLIANGDLRLIKQVVDNLIENSWKYSHGEQAPTIDFGMTNTDFSAYTFYVRDNGVGFDVDNAEGLFTPFTCFHDETQFEGTGIGLATAYRIIKRHGGDIWVTSQVDKMTSFYFVIND